MIAAAEVLGHEVGVEQACAALDVSRATLYRHRIAPAERPPCSARRPSPPRALALDERQKILGVLNSDRFVDTSPKQVVATLLDEGVYHCSARTMHRILADAGASRERRRQRSHPPRPVPRLEATAPKQVWSWDITWLPGPEKRTRYALYVVMDIFSRYVVGWMLADRECSTFATRLVTTALEREAVHENAITLHQDRGAPMRARTFMETMVDLGLLLSYSRPRVSNDNPYSESQFKTLKYMPTYPGRFDSMEDARAWCTRFFAWFNHEHRHSGIAMLTPHDVHVGRADEVLQQRQSSLDEAFVRHPERFVRGSPRVQRLPRSVGINSPSSKSVAVEAANRSCVGEVA